MPALWRHAVAGVVLCIPYPHTDTVNGGPSPLEASSSAAAAGDSYELIAALTRLRGILFGEDFQQFLRGGATQRYSLTTYLDLFCYQPPEHRCGGTCCCMLSCVLALWPPFVMTPCLLGCHQRSCGPEVHGNEPYRI